MSFFDDSMKFLGSYIVLNGVCWSFHEIPWGFHGVLGVFYGILGDFHDGSKGIQWHFYGVLWGFHEFSMSFHWGVHRVLLSFSWDFPYLLDEVFLRFHEVTAFCPYSSFVYFYSIQHLVIIPFFLWRVYSIFNCIILHI